MAEPVGDVSDGADMDPASWLNFCSCSAMPLSDGEPSCRESCGELAFQWPAVSPPAAHILLAPHRLHTFAFAKLARLQRVQTQSSFIADHQLDAEASEEDGHEPEPALQPAIGGADPW